jgi:hypothetical protein
LTEHLVGISEWSSKNKLAIAPEKSSVTLFSPDMHQSNIHPDVRYEGVLLPLAKEVKWLGSNLSKHFTPSQIKDIKVKTSPRVQLMKAISGQDWGDKETLTLTYNALVKPIITNNAAVWFPSIDPNSEAIKTLQIIQNNAMLTITSSHKMSSQDHFLAKTELLPIAENLRLICTHFWPSWGDHPSHSVIKLPTVTVLEGKA